MSDTGVQSVVIFRECKSQNCQCFLIWDLKERIWSSLPGERRASMLAPDRDKIGTDLGCQPASSGRVAQCRGCWPKRLAWHSPCVHSRRAKWKKKTPETFFQAHGIQWPVDVDPFVRHRLSAVWCGGETGKPVVGSGRAGGTLPPNDAAFQGSQLRRAAEGAQPSEAVAWTAGAECTGHWSRWRRA